MKITDFPEHYQKQIRSQLETHNRNSGSASDKKRNAWYKSLAKETFTRFNGPVDITFHTTRRRETDNRAIEDKYFTDSLVTCGLLQDDSKKYVARLEVPEPTIGTDERTIITITDEI